MNMWSSCARIRVPSVALTAAGVAGVAALLAASPALADNASGKLVFQARAGEITLEVRYAHLVSGPDFAAGGNIRRLLLSPVDLAPLIAKCEELSCATWDMGEGVTVDFDAPPRLGYWFVANGQRVQHSGTARNETVTLEVDTPDRLAGSWTLPAQGGGPEINVKFDASLLKSFAK